MVEQTTNVNAFEIDNILGELINESPAVWETRRPIESVRWYEFVGCVLKSVGGSETSPDFVSTALDALVRLDLIDIEDLVEDSEGTEDDRPSIADFDFTKEVLVRAGFNAASAEKALAAILQTASFLAKRYDSRVQALLRHHGNAMVESLIAELQIPALDDDTKRTVIVQWLQNTLDLPVPVRTRPIRIADAEIDVSAFIAAADRADLKVAFLDELFDQYEATSMQVSPDDSAAAENEEGIPNDV